MLWDVQMVEVPDKYQKSILRRKRLSNGLLDWMLRVIMQWILVVGFRVDTNLRGDQLDVDEDSD